MATDYGRDVSCIDSLRTGRLVKGARLVAEAAYRRLITPPGSLRGGDDENNYGLDLTALVGEQSPANVAASLPARIRAELLKDERISEVEVTATVSTSGPRTSISLKIVGQTNAGPFDLKLSASEMSVELAGLTV
jgi:hypothetical protein